MDNGVIKFFNDEKGFGFITDNESGQDVFFHISNVISDAEIKKGDQVEFEVIEGKKGLMAVKIKPIN